MSATSALRSSPCLRRLLPPKPELLQLKSRNLRLRSLAAAPIQQQFESRPTEEDKEESASILCDSCKGSGWLLCDFCEGQKINVKSETNRIYRRCPSCKAAGFVLCQKCKVFKCVTFPDYEDGQM